jgi:hypothetical protein
MLLEGDGAAKDAAAAFENFVAAAETGDADGQNMLGRRYENGWGGLFGWEHVVVTLVSVMACENRPSSLCCSVWLDTLAQLHLDGLFSQAMTGEISGSD